ncbi:MAG TPA: hypothetical protein VFT55_00680 [Planctomycetota bacterium]|nr:hypothetical protein [Planctomycetota bacterium]
MSLPDEEVMDLLQERFLVGFKNIEKESHVGMSHGYRPNQTAVGTTNGAGGRNVQLIVLAADETVLHVLPGFWHAQDLAAELRLALEIHRLHLDETKGSATKKAMFAALHRSHLRRHLEESRSRSEWQGFDQHAEIERCKNETRDTVTFDNGNPTIKPILQVVHERMMARPFKRLADFDMESFVDYGRAYYDNNMGVDKGKQFYGAQHANEKRERDQAKAAKAAARKKGRKGEKKDECECEADAQDAKE